MKRRNLCTMVAISLAAFSMTAILSGCGGQTADGQAAQGQDAPGEKVYTIGLTQFAEHPSLDNCREGFIQGLAENGFVEGENVKFEYQNAQADMATTQQIAQGFVSSRVDLIGAVATPSAQAAFNAAESAGIPVVYVAVSDPAASGLAGEDGTSGKNITGVSDMIPVAKQLDMIREILPDAKKIGVLYSTGETNSESQLALYQELAPEKGFEIVASGVTSTADVALAAQALAAKTDCFTNLTDNTVVSALATEIDKATAAGIPVFGSEIEQVKNGCLASEGIDYIALGKQAGAMAAKKLNGEDISKMPYETVTESSTDVNTDVATALGITIPDSVKDRATLHQNGEAAS